MKYSVLLILVLGITVGGCQKDKEQAPTQEPAVARGTLSVTEQDLQQGLDLLSEQDRKFAETSFGRQNLLQILTREKLILQDARDTGLEQGKEYKQALAQKRAELDAIYDQFAQEALVRAWYEDKDQKLQPSEEEIKAYYDKYPYEMTMKQIITDNAQTADQMLRILKSSPGRWSEVSHQHNIAPASLKTLTFMPGEYLDNLEVVAANSPIGKVQGFFKTPQGFHIIMKTAEKRLSFEQAAPRIKQILLAQRLDELLDTLKTQYEVIIYDKNQ